MEGTYQELRDITMSQELFERLAVAVVDVAIEIYNESVDTPNHTERQAYAITAAGSPRSIAERMRYAVVLLAESNSDAHIRTAVLSAWDAFASVTTEAIA